MIAYNPTLLKLAREQNGLSQTALATALDVQQALLSKYEHGTIVPPEAMQEKIARQLDYPKSFFLQDNEDLPSGLIFHRKRSSLAAKIRLPIEAEARVRALDILHLDGVRKLRANIVPREGLTPRELARRLRAHWNCSPGPIDDLTELLERNNVVVFSFDFHTDKLDGFFLPLPREILAIALNANEALPPDRRRFTLAHELGHAVLEHYFNAFPDAVCEREADTFASEFLLPEADVKGDLTPPLTLSKLKALKTKWRVSMQSLIRRAHDLKCLNDALYRRICIVFSAQGFRKREPGIPLPPESPNLLTNRMREFVKRNPDTALTDLHLTAHRFRTRYPQVEGWTEMPVKVS